MTGVVLMVTEFLFGPVVGGLASAAVACVFGVVWFGIAAAVRREPFGSADLVDGPVHARPRSCDDGDRTPPGQ
jgi:hypothetical protein